MAQISMKPVDPVSNIFSSNQHELIEQVYLGMKIEGENADARVLTRAKTISNNHEFLTLQPRNIPTAHPREASARNTHAKRLFCCALAQKGEEMFW